MEFGGIQPPVMHWEDSNLPEAWEKFQRHAELVFSGPLKGKTEEEQISYLLLWVGEKGRDMHCTCNFPALPLLSLKSSIDLGLIQLTYAVTDDVTGLSKEEVMTNYGDLFTGIGIIPGTAKLHLKEGAVPVVNPPRRVPEAHKARLYDELKRMEDNKIISKVDIPTDWVNSLVVVEKPKTGKLRVCLDLKALNEAIRRQHYPMQTLDDVTLQLVGCEYFSLLDITHACWSIKLDDESSYLTTFSTPFGRYRYLRLPFGISSGQDIFVKKVNEIFEGLPGIAAVVDDILIYGKTRKDHDRNLRAVLELARAKCIRFNPDK
ncbi:uncharacterized protein K02A2.6-like [Mercenaria mercenaria]|uniref:uncharacterized protein K02A2.6-like n=1 Tax=Mercenaria mercenaria TaxID=6596 RepID=UPI00234ED036|nr:uncharacterized protein K02A2.6-like [Mercenaria mercenaria]